VPEVLDEVSGVVEERKPESREKGVGLAGVDERGGLLCDALHDDVGLPDDAVVVVVVNIPARTPVFLLEDLELRLRERHFAE